MGALDKISLIFLMFTVFCFGMSLILYVQSQTSSMSLPNPESSYFQYRDICLQAVQDESVFATFKRHPHYTPILEHLTYQQGRQYAKEIERLCIFHTLDWEKLCKNDDLGSANKQHFTVSGIDVVISPSTLRYVCLGFKFLNHVAEQKDPNPIHIIEVGGGYGGQCYILYSLCDLFQIKIASYTIFDLPEPSQLQVKYLGHMLQDVSNVHFRTQENPGLLADSSYLFSAYALGEISLENKEFYYKLFRNKLKHGYVVWNCDQDPSENFHQMLVQTVGSRDVMWSEETPKSFHWNKVISF